GGVPGQQRHGGGGQLGLDLLRVLAGGEAGAQLGMRPRHREEGAAVVLPEGGQVETGVVQLPVRIQHVAARGARVDVQPLHPPGAGVGLAAPHPGRAQQLLRPLAQRDGVPALPDGAAARSELDAHESSSPSRESRSNSRSSSRVVSQSSPGPTVSSASACLSCSTVSIFSSTVPALTCVFTVTSRRCPMRKARSVAWFSTAGFHQRSRCTTWLAAVSVSPVPPARRLRSISPGRSRCCWNSATIWSRSRLETPPCRNGTSIPNSAKRSRQ